MVLVYKYFYEVDFKYCAGPSERVKEEGENAEFMGTTFWFQGMPWNHCKLHPASYKFPLKSRNILCIFGISPPSDSLAQITIQSNFDFRELRELQADHNKLHLLSWTPPYSVGSERGQFSHLYLFQSTYDFWGWIFIYSCQISQFVQVHNNMLHMSVTLLHLG